MLTPDEWVALLGAVAVLLGALAAAIVSIVKAGAEAAKTRAEVAAMRAELETGRRADAERRALNDKILAETHHQVTPNNGGSIIDATGRLEVAVEALHKGLERVESTHRNTAADVRGMRRDIGRIYDDNREHARDADTEHRRLQERIDAVADRLPPLPAPPPHNVD